MHVIFDIKRVNRNHLNKTIFKVIIKRKINKSTYLFIKILLSYMCTTILPIREKKIKNIIPRSFLLNMEKLFVLHCFCGHTSQYIFSEKIYSFFFFTIFMNASCRCIFFFVSELILLYFITNKYRRVNFCVLKEKFSVH